ncbi:MAG: hypothetical protein ACRCYY_05005 [Trueperaceae bacterium]
MFSTVDAPSTRYLTVIATTGNKRNNVDLLDYNEELRKIYVFPSEDRIRAFLSILCNQQSNNTILLATLEKIEFNSDTITLEKIPSKEVGFVCTR